MERNNTHRRLTPSFSSILLHAIDRSIDEADGIGNTRVQTPCTCNRSRSNSTTPAAATYNQQQQQYGGTRNPKLRVKEKRFSSSEAESSVGGSLVDVSPTNKQKNKQKKKKQDSKSLGNRFRASKLYAEIKKAKPPVSPGSRLASFVNQLFTSTGKTTTTNQNLIDRYRSYSTTSSSSYLNKALSSKSLNNSKLTVRVDEEIVMDDDETRSYCSSSDLFELENLTGVGALDNYTNELPVYETTHLQTNRVIARRLIV
ncbi:hypothetical protein ZOSMA_188G00060 [Zostera marina]|uniref:Protein BIG GRAIN 1-like B n=1 Tax=Zostera marina TaxID=29655 RepID=A0A0K9PPY8_ZOSMR|nr:hypothetical protein ZOSMA_188G00060 [Zostera marina]